jgi:hypothetical protein
MEYLFGNFELSDEATVNRFRSHVNFSPRRWPPVATLAMSSATKADDRPRKRAEQAGLLGTFFAHFLSKATVWHDQR